MPVFRVTEAVRGSTLVLEGRHRFSRYALVLRIEPAGDGTLLRAETRALFPGLTGRAYRMAVIGSRGHVLGVRGLATKGRAES